MRILSIIALMLFAALALAPAAGAQQWEVEKNADECDDHDWGQSYCETRETTLPADRDIITVNADPNGSIRVRGWDRDEISLRVRIRVWDDDWEDGESIAEEIEIVIDEHVISADGPRQRKGRSWSASFELMVPHKSNLDLESLNGGISIQEVAGDIEFETTNGGVRLAALSGDVEGHTTNGGLEIELEGDSWDGEGMDVRTTNGGVKVYIPEDYSAELVTGTVNGSLNFDFPIVIEGKIKKQIRTSLGDGGARVRATTTNGGVRIQRS